MADIVINIEDRATATLEEIDAAIEAIKKAQKAREAFIGQARESAQAELFISQVREKENV